MPTRLRYDDFLARLHSLYRVVPQLNSAGEGELWVDPLDETLATPQPVSDDVEFAQTHCLLNRVLIDNARQHAQPTTKSVTAHNANCVLCRTYASSLQNAN